AKRTAAEKSGERSRFDPGVVTASLDALFHEIYRRIGAGLGGQQKARLLQLLSLAREPLSCQQLCDLMAVDGQPMLLDECRDRLEQMSQWLLDTGDGRFKPWHQGLSDYVRAQVLGLAACHQGEEVFCRWLVRPFAETGLYGLRHRPGHLMAARRFDAVCALL